MIDMQTLQLRAAYLEWSNKKSQRWLGTGPLFLEEHERKAEVGPIVLQSNLITKLAILTSHALKTYHGTIYLAPISRTFAELARRRTRASLLLGTA